MTILTVAKPTVIKFQAQVWSIKTLVDGGVNVTLSLSEKEIKQVAQLLECKKGNAVLEVAAVPIKPEAVIAVKHAPTRRKQRYPYRT